VQLGDFNRIILNHIQFCLREGGMVGCERSREKILACMEVVLNFFAEGRKLGIRHDATAFLTRAAVGPSMRPSAVV
jgi:hypothetical protein